MKGGYPNGTEISSCRGSGTGAERIKALRFKLIRQLNEELKSNGFITISGRINREYFNERLYGAREEN